MKKSRGRRLAAAAVKGDGHVPTAEVGGNLPTADAGSASFLSRHDQSRRSPTFCTRAGSGFSTSFPTVSLSESRAADSLVQSSACTNSPCATIRLPRPACASRRARRKRTRGDDPSPIRRIHLSARRFYEAFGTPEIIGPDFCPLHTALGSGELAKSSLRVGEKTYLRSAGPARRAGRGRKPEPARGHRPRHLGRGAAAAEAERDLPGGPRAGRSVAATTSCR